MASTTTVVVDATVDRPAHSQQKDAPMHPILVAGAGSVAMLVAVAVALFRARPVRRPAVVEARVPRANVRVLRTEAELGEAIRRAALSERLAADACRNRADRYEAMLRPSGHPVPGVDERDHQPLSA